MSCLLKISYKKLNIKLAEKGITKAEFRKQAKISTGTLTKFNRDEPVRMDILLSVCEYLNCDIGDICSAVPIDEVG